MLFIYALTDSSKRQFPAGLAKLKSCRLHGIDEELLCGHLTVFENRHTRGGRTIDLNIVVLPAFDQQTKREPLFDLAGGPGAASTEAAGFYANQGKEFRRRRDVVLVDQRGTGKSNPLTVSKIKTAEYYLSEMYPVEYVKSLRQRLEQRSDLTQYTTSIAMDDLDDVRAWLGYDRINLFGLSYGTRAALVYLRQHPQHVRTVTLMGVAPTYLKMPMYHAQAATRAMKLLLEQCEQDAQCHEAFPHIDDDWAKVLTQLERAPARVEYSPPDNSAPVMVEIQRDIFAEKIRTWMYGRDQASRIPLIVHRAADGDFGPFLHEAIGPSIPDFIADGMYLSVTCAEDVPFIDQEQAAKLNAGNPFGNYRVFQQTRACSMWPRGEIPRNFSAPVSANAPVLIFSGKMDPVTPPQRGDEVASYLPNSRHIVIPQAAHGVDGLTDPGCIDRIMMDFLEKGDATDLEVSCVERMAPPPFATKQEN
ncbi:MAG: alpha/beta hydrolase [Verrucomicrobia bacterium]|nr:MAG: alpha/beta hydrolase [Verrucomicrobiota bacterium]